MVRYLDEARSCFSLQSVQTDSLPHRTSYSTDIAWSVPAGKARQIGTRRELIVVVVSKYLVGIFFFFSAGRALLTPGTYIYVCIYILAY